VERSSTPAPIAQDRASGSALSPQITGSKKQSDEERGAALFAVRVHLPCYAFIFALL